MVKLSEIFDIRYGNQFDYLKMSPCESSGGISFVSRGSTDCGFVGKVLRYEDTDPFPAGLITVTMGGSYLLASFVQQEPFYTGQNIKVLSPREPMSDEMKLFYCAAIQHNRFRYHSHSREANSTFDDIPVPSRSEVPLWIEHGKVGKLGPKPKQAPTSLPAVSGWRPFRYSALFDIRKGKRLTKEAMQPGAIPFIGATDANNGITAYVANDENVHPGNLITVSYNGSIAEAFYQPEPFVASDDINVLYPKFTLDRFIGIFLCTLIRREKYRYNYGRKWHKEIMERSEIRLPVTVGGDPDFALMRRYIEGLAYSTQL